MFQAISMTGTGVLTYLLSFVLSYLGVNADAGQVSSWVQAILEVLGLVMIVVGQITRKDLKWGIKRR